MSRVFVMNSLRGFDMRQPGPIKPAVEFRDLGLNNPVQVIHGLLQAADFGLD
jgi:hypothetical protein